MKKIFIFLIVAVILVFLSDKIYKIYSRNFINSHESIILINDKLSDNDIDGFFKLSEGTYDSKKHIVVYSLLKRDKDAYLLETYLNLPVKYGSRFAGKDQFDCDPEYLEVQPYGFYNYEIGNTTIIARLISIDASPIKRLSGEQTISEKALRAGFVFGEINILDVGKNGVTSHCR